MTTTTINNRWASEHADVDWLTDRIAVGGGIFGCTAMREVAAAGITHVISLAEFDETKLAAPHGVAVCWNHADDDGEPKAAAWFERGVDFAKAVLRDRSAKLYVHCAAGIHRGPLMALAVLCAMGWSVEKAMRHIERCRPQVDFPPVYVESVVRYLEFAEALRRERRVVLDDGGGALVGKARP
jgi:protein-tyrosine phosphatase